jgi:hypothetical protein
MIRKLYCYVDETGQHTQGRLFIVSVVVADWERDRLREACGAVEAHSGKGRTKWIKTLYERRIAYIQQVLDNPLFAGRLNFAVFRNTRDYSEATAYTVSPALEATGLTAYKANVTIDGLPRAQERLVATLLRRQGVPLRKVRGIKDESDALIRLADAICGLVSAAMEDQPAMKALFERGIGTGWLRDVSGQQKNPLG